LEFEVAEHLVAVEHLSDAGLGLAAFAGGFGELAVLQMDAVVLQVPRR